MMMGMMNILMMMMVMMMNDEDDDDGAPKKQILWVEEIDPRTWIIIYEMPVSNLTKSRGCLQQQKL